MTGRAWGGGGTGERGGGGGWGGGGFTAPIPHPTDKTELNHNKKIATFWITAVNLSFYCNIIHLQYIHIIFLFIVIFSEDEICFLFKIA